MKNSGAFLLEYFFYLVCKMDRLFMKMYQMLFGIAALGVSCFNAACSFDDSSSSAVKPDYTVYEGTLVDERDGQVYKTVTIVDKYDDSVTWMAENLNFEPKIGKSFCHECEKYGRLYTWAAAVDSAAEFSDEAKGFGFHNFMLSGYIELEGHVRGVCPEGWRLIDYNDFDWFRMLTKSGDPVNYAVKMMKSATDWNGIDEFGLNILPAGYHYEGTYYATPSAEPEHVVEWREGGEAAYFWTSNDHGNADGAFAEYFAPENYDPVFPDVQKSKVLTKFYGLSVRCIKR